MALRDVWSLLDHQNSFCRWNLFSSEVFTELFVILYFLPWNSRNFIFSVRLNMISEAFRITSSLPYFQMFQFFIPRSNSWSCFLFNFLRLYKMTIVCLNMYLSVTVVLDDSYLLTDFNLLKQRFSIISYIKEKILSYECVRVSMCVWGCANFLVWIIKSKPYNLHAWNSIRIGLLYSWLY